MKDPIKIIHKFKNNNRRIQYKLYIFLGDQLPEEIINILEHIKNKDFYATLVYLSMKQFKTLESYYDAYWYKLFFVNDHLKNQFKIIESSPAKKREIENKYGKEWFGEHINKNKLIKITYSFADYYYDNLLEEKKKQISNKSKELDFRTHVDVLMNNPLTNRSHEYSNEELVGGSDSNSGSDYELIGGEDEESDDEEEINVEELDDIIEEEYNVDDIAVLYSQVNESNKSINETSKLISEAINDKKWKKR